MKLQLSKLLLSSILLSSISAKNLGNTVGDIHTLTNEKDSLEIMLSYQKMNDTLDLLNIKDKEFSNSSNLGSIGDLTGYELKLKYSPTDRLQLNYTRTMQDIKYTSSTLSNTRNDIFLRYNLVQKDSAIINNGISIDVGFVMNKLDNLYIRDIETINQTALRISKATNSDKTLKIKEADSAGLNPIYVCETSNCTTNRESDADIKNPYLSLENTNDKSYYLRILTGFHTKKTIFDFYLGYKKTKISNRISANSDIKDLFNSESQDLKLPLNLDRREYMLFTGFNISRDIGKFITEFNYEYERFFRDEGLDYINFNHVINASIARPITKKLLVFIGAKVMYRQFNGQIPYLYNKYSQTTYDHKYGYAKIGLQYKFNF